MCIKLIFTLTCVCIIFNTAINLMQAPVLTTSPYLLISMIFKINCPHPYITCILHLQKHINCILVLIYKTAYAHAYIHNYCTFTHIAIKMNMQSYKFLLYTIFVLLLAI